MPGFLKPNYYNIKCTGVVFFVPMMFVQVFLMIEFFIIFLAGIFKQKKNHPGYTKRIFLSISSLSTGETLLIFVIKSDCYKRLGINAKDTLMTDFHRKRIL